MVQLEHQNYAFKSLKPVIACINGIHFFVFSALSLRLRKCNKKIFEKLFDDGSPSISFAKYLFYACANLYAFIIKGAIDQNICTIWAEIINCICYYCGLFLHVDINISKKNTHK